MGLFTRKTVDFECRKALDEATKVINGLVDESRRLRDHLDELHSEHRKLRGRFYASRGEMEVAPRAAESKADILRRIGYVPGQPVKHGG